MSERADLEKLVSELREALTNAETILGLRDIDDWRETVAAKCLRDELDKIATCRRELWGLRIGASRTGT